MFLLELQRDKTDERVVMEVDNLKKGLTQKTNPSSSKQVSIAANNVLYGIDDGIELRFLIVLFMHFIKTQKSTNVLNMVEAKTPKQSSSNKAQEKTMTMV